MRPPGVRVPRRASAPGTFSRYQAKSSPPRDWAVGSRFSRPSTPRTAAASTSTLAGLFETGGTPRSWVTRASTPQGRTRSARTSSSSSSARSQASWSRQRRVPSRVPALGIALKAEPAWIEPQVRFTPERGSMRRVSAAGSCVAIEPSA